MNRPTDPQLPARRVVARRYELLDAIGRGGFGTVWRALDRLSGGHVAVKFCDVVDAAPRHVRREIATLRLLRVPGVVRLFDEGQDEGTSFLVMEIVDGVRFPGAATPAPWESIAETAAALLETLARIHACGVVHRDLKPSNVLVDAAGRPTVLDFGLAHTATYASISGKGELLGTPAYLAPEQLTGEVVGPPTDLYALGVMLFEALSGELPFGRLPAIAALYARAFQEAPPLADRSPGTPPHVAEAVDAMLRRSPEERPRSAGEALERLRGRCSVPASLDGPRLRDEAPLDDDALRALIAGPDRVLHLQEDAARLLRERSGGRAAGVEAEARAWIRAGLARWDGERLVVRRDDLERLAAGTPLAPAPTDDAPTAALPRGVEDRLLFLIASADADTDAATLAELSAEGVAASAARAADGRLGAAEAVLRETLLALRRHGEAGSAFEGPVLDAWVDVALAENTPDALDRVLYELARSPAPSPGHARVESLVHAALAARTNGEHALALADALSPFDDPRLDRWRQEVRVVAARRCSPAEEARVVAEAEVWARGADTREARAGLAAWRARLHYRRGHYDEAAEAWLLAAREEPDRGRRLSALTGAASALIEVGRHEEAEGCAQEALTTARGARLAYVEARAEWLLRTTRYRRGCAGEVDHDLVEAVAAVGVADLEGLVCLTEAAVAWRRGHGVVAASLAERAATLWSRSGWSWVLILPRALVAAGRGATGDDAAAITRDAMACPTPSVAIQALALLASAFPERRDDLRAKTWEMARMESRATWGVRREFVSVDEALAIVDGAHCPR